MTREAEMAIQASMTFEAKKDALRQVQDGGVKVTLSIHPQDMPAQLYSDIMGQRYVVVMVPVDDNDEPKQAERVPLTPFEKPKSFAGQAKMICEKPDFVRFMEAADPIEAEMFLESHCRVKSCAEITEGTEAGLKFKALQQEYYDWKNTPPIEAYEESP